GLITRRSQVQILPPLLKRPCSAGPFLVCVSAAATPSRDLEVSPRRRVGEVLGVAAEDGVDPVRAARFADELGPDGATVRREAVIRDLAPLAEAVALHDELERRAGMGGNQISDRLRIGAAVVELVAVLD